jgi:hypothetical protein
MESINVVIDANITNRSQKLMTKDCVAPYKFVINIVTCPGEYIKLALVSFQEESDLYGQLLIRVYGLKDCTSYIPVLIAHFLHYMKNYKCLHQYSQQGWEHWNSVKTSLFFRRTQ